MDASLSGAVDVVVVRLDAPSDAFRRCTTRLSPSELRRALRFARERDRRRYIVSRARLRELLSERLGAAPEAIPLVAAAQGKLELGSPYAGGWCFNLAHCEDLAVYVFARQRAVGVDVEALRPLPEADAIAELAFSPGEKRAYEALPPHEKVPGFFACWTRMEAIAKGLGCGLTVPFGEIEPGRVPRWHLQNFFPADGFIAALAVQMDAAP